MPTTRSPYSRRRIFSRAAASARLPAAELPGELGPGELPAAVVDRAQQPREIVRAQLGTSGRRALVLPHTPIVPRLVPVRTRGGVAYQGYQSQWKPTTVVSASRRYRWT